jgi:hypothetical protein
MLIRIKLGRRFKGRLGHALCYMESDLPPPLPKGSNRTATAYHRGDNQHLNKIDNPMNKLSKKNIGVGCVMLLLLGGSQAGAWAAPLTFFGEDLGPGESPPGLAVFPNSTAAEAAFLSNLVGVGTETFESFGTGTTAPLALNFPGAGTATLNGNGVIRSGHVGFGRYPISGTQWWEASSIFSISFDDPVAAFGFYGVDIGDFGGQVTLQLANGGVTQLVIPNTINGPGGSVLYFGYIDTDNPFTSVTFGNTAAGTDVFAFDNMTIGSIEQVRPPSVPDTGGSALLLGCAMAALGIARFRKKA